MYPRPLNRAWKERVLESAANVLIIPSTRARPSTVENTPVHTKTTDVSDSNADSNDNEKESPNKRQRIDSVAGTCSNWPASPEAYQLFRPRGNNGGGNSDSSSESPQEALKRRISQLQSVHESEDSWRSVVKGGDADNFCTKSKIFEIRQRATFLCYSYQLALANMNQWTWHDCCKEA